MWTAVFHSSIFLYYIYIILYYMEEEIRTCALYQVLFVCCSNNVIMIHCLTQPKNQ